MKNILWIAVTFILWLGVILLLEYDYRSNENVFLATFSPVQWFILVVLIWSVISTLNIYIFLMQKNLLDAQWKSIMFVIEVRDLILCLIPITNIFILISNVVNLLYNILEASQDIKQIPFEEEFNKNTIQK